MMTTKRIVKMKKKAKLKAAKKDKIYRAVRCASSANKGKTSQAQAIITPFRTALACFITNLDKDLQQGIAPSKFCKWKPDDFESSLSGRQFQNAYGQALESYKSWLALLEGKARSIIANSSLDEFTKTVLYRVNLYHNWYRPELELNWIRGKDGNLIPCRSDDPNKEVLAVSKEHLKLARLIVKRARQLIHRPNLLRVKTFKLNATVALLEQGHNSFNYWLKLSTMEKGKPIFLPLKNNPYLDRHLQTGRLLNNIQLKFEGNSIFISPIIEQEAAEERGTGAVIGLDWGTCALFAASDGRLLGQKMLFTLKEWDEILTKYAAELQRLEKPLKQDPYYVHMQKRISDYVKNEVGRLLNQLSREDILEIVVEKLDFRHTRLSKATNRIITRAGRGAVKNKLSRLQEEQGIKVTYINAAYTSQQCNVCGYIDRANRKDQKHFKCLCCGHTSNADVNAARNIKDRRSILISLDSSNAVVRKNLRERLFDRHILCCPSGRHHAAASKIGLAGAE